MKCECGICLKCKNREACKKYRKNNPEKQKQKNERQREKRKISGYLKKYLKENPLIRKKIAERRKIYVKENLEKIKSQVKRHQAKNRDKYLARQDLRRAVLRGKIIKPSICQNCNIEKDKIEGHHTDYSKRLEVIWLCKECHQNEHKRIGGIL